MKVFIANFGIGNSLWESCLANSTIATFEDEDTWPLWRDGDREGYIDLCVATKKTASGITPPRSVASRWFNNGIKLSMTEGDLWIHKHKKDLWWAISKPGKAEVSLEPSLTPGKTTSLIYVMRKQVEGWSNKTEKGRGLEWSGLHAKAQDFLSTEGTLQKLSDDIAKYAVALINGDDLTPWHSRPDWRAKEAKGGRGPVTIFNARERSILDMAMTARNTVSGANGQQVLRTVKNKELRFGTMLAFEKYIGGLLEAQEYLCAITGIRLQFEGDCDDPELLCSLDRIDSAGHYEAGNLQIVCRFVNRWKGSENDVDFRRLINLVRSGDSFE